MDLPDPKHLDALPLLDAVIQETLRLWPAITGRQPRVTPADAAGVELAGHAGLPPGVTVQAYAFVLHRHPGVFPEPEKWRPERWMKTEGADGEEKERRLAEMRRWFWAFGSGGRACIGRHFAWNGEFFCYFSPLSLPCFHHLLCFVCVLCACSWNEVDGLGLKSADIDVHCLYSYEARCCVHLHKLYDRNRGRGGD